MNQAFVAAFAIGIIAGLRSMTAPAAVSWGAYLKWISLENSRLAFLGSTAAVVVLSLLALVELVNDKLPKTPNRTAAVPFIARIVTGAFSGLTLCVAGNMSAIAGAVLGVIGAIVGTYGGFYARSFLTNSLRAPGIAIAILEDVIAIAGGLMVVACFR